MEDEWARLAGALRDTLSSAEGGVPAEGEFGRFRDQGRTGRTMGIMAGGPFLGRIKDVSTVPAGEGGAEGVARKVFEVPEAGKPGQDWGMRPVYVLTPGETIAVPGFTGERMEARSFSIEDEIGDFVRTALF